MRHSRTLLATILLAASAPLAPAQQEPPKDAPVTTKVEVSKTKLLRVGADIGGSTLVSPKNEPLGKVENVIVHPRGDIAFIEFSPSASLQAGPARYPVPWRALTRNESGHFVLAVTPEKFKGGPRYEKPPLDNFDWWLDADREFASIVNASATPVEASSSLAPAKSLYLGSELRSRTIENPDGQKVATVQEVVIDPNAGRIAYVVIGVGGEGGGTGQRVIAVPWEALKSMPDKTNPKVERLTLATTKEQLEKAPEFVATSDGWKAASEPAYVLSIYEHYSLPPYRIVRVPEPQK